MSKDFEFIMCAPVRDTVWLSVCLHYRVFLLQCDKDLVQQVKQLRRSLDDAEGLSRDTKKEWAFLRSENISLKQRDVSSLHLGAKILACHLGSNTNDTCWQNTIEEMTNFHQP